MDSQFISILIGVGVVVGLPLLEKLIDKIKQGAQGGSTPQPQQRQTPPPPRPRQHRQQAPRPQQRPEPVQLVEEEGVRVTTDNPASFTAPEPDPVSPQLEELRKAVIWSEILNNPKFKEF